MLTELKICRDVEEKCKKYESIKNVKMEVEGKLVALHHNITWHVIRIEKNTGKR